MRSITARISRPAAVCKNGMDGSVSLPLFTIIGGYPQFGQAVWRAKKFVAVVKDKNNHEILNIEIEFGKEYDLTENRRV